MEAVIARSFCSPMVSKGDLFVLMWKNYLSNTEMIFAVILHCFKLNDSIFIGEDLN